MGSVVGQIAKIKGCKVIGLAGSDEKGKWLVEELGYDNFINYKDNIRQKIHEYAPKGIDCYFDNVSLAVGQYKLKSRLLLVNMEKIIVRIQKFSGRRRDKYHYFALHESVWKSGGMWS